MSNTVEPEFSIVIPVFNGEKSIRRCLDSVINQTFRNIEIIVVDDCSNDDTADILSEYQQNDDRICIIKKKENQSQLAAKRDGMIQARGNYVLFVDCDDYVEEKVCECLYGTVHSKASDIIEFSYITEPSGEIVSVDSDGISDTQEVLKRILQWKHPHISWNKCYSRRLINRFLEKAECFYCNLSEDIYHSVLFFSLAESYSGIKNVLYHYVLGSGVSTSEDRMVMNIEKNLESVKNKNEHLRKYLNESSIELLPDFELSVSKEINNLAGICVGSSLGAYDKIAALRLIDDSFGTDYSVQYEEKHALFDRFLNGGSMVRIKMIIQAVKRKISGSGNEA